MAESRRKGSRAESNLSLELKGGGKEVYGAGHWSLCRPLHPDPLIDTACGLFHFETPQVDASLWQNRLSGRRNVCEMDCASSACGARTLLSGRAFFERGSTGVLGRREKKEKASSTKQPCWGAGAAHRIISSKRLFLSQTCPLRATVSPADRDLTPGLARRNTFPYWSESRERCLVKGLSPTI